MGLGYGAAVNSIREVITFTVAEQNLKRVSFPPALIVNQLRPSMLRAEKLLFSNFLEFHTSDVETFKFYIQDRHTALNSLNTVVQDCISDTNDVWKGEAAEAARAQLQGLQKDIEAQAHIYGIAEHNIDLGLKATISMVGFAQGQAWMIAQTKRPIAIDNLLRATTDALMAMGGDGIDSVIGAVMGKDKATKYGFKFSPGAAIIAGIKGLRGGLGELVEGVKDMQRSLKISMNVLDALCDLVESAEEELDRIWSIVWSKTESGEKLSPTFTHQLKPVKVEGVEPPTCPQDRDIKCNPKPPLKELPQFKCPAPHDDDDDGHGKKSGPEPAPQKHEPKVVVPNGGGLNGGNSGSGSTGSGSVGSGHYGPQPSVDPSDIGKNHETTQPPIVYPPADDDKFYPPSSGPHENMPRTDNGHPPYGPGPHGGTHGTNQTTIINNIIQAGTRTAQMVHNELWNAFMNGGVDGTNPLLTPEGGYNNTPGTDHPPYPTGGTSGVTPQPGLDHPQTHQPGFNGSVDVGVHGSGAVTTDTGNYAGSEHNSPSVQTGHVPESGHTADNTSHAANNGPSWSLRIEGEIGVEVSVEGHGEISVEAQDHDGPAETEAAGVADTQDTDRASGQDDTHHDEPTHDTGDDKQSEEKGGKDDKSAHQQSSDAPSDEPEPADDKKKGEDTTDDAAKNNDKPAADDSVEKTPGEQRDQNSTQCDTNPNDDASVDEEIHTTATVESQVHTQSAAVNQTPPTETTPADMPAAPVSASVQSDLANTGLSKAGMW